MLPGPESYSGNLTFKFAWKEKPIGFRGTRDKKTSVGETYDTVLDADLTLGLDHWFERNGSRVEVKHTLKMPIVSSWKISLRAKDAQKREEREPDGSIRPLILSRSARDAQRPMKP